MGAAGYFFVWKQPGHILNEIEFNQDFWNELNLLFYELYLKLTDAKHWLLQCNQCHIQG